MCKKPSSKTVYVISAIPIIFENMYPLSAKRENIFELKGKKITPKIKRINHQ